MRRLIPFWILILIILMMAAGCSYEDSGSDSVSIETTPGPATEPTLTPEPTPRQPYVFDPENPDYREAMRQWVVDIGTAARERDEDFILIPQNCSPLFTYSGEYDGIPTDFFLDAINGVGRESLCFGYRSYGIKRPDDYRDSVIDRLNIAAGRGIPVLSIDYCSDPDQIAYADAINQENGFLGFFAESRALTELPEGQPLYENADNILSLQDAKNFICVINPGGYESKEAFVEALSETNYDVLIIDAEYNEESRLTSQDVSALKAKANGGKRIVVSYLSIGEAEDYRAYWDDNWLKAPPEWLGKENPNWRGNYIVSYWDKEWQGLIAFNDDSSLNKIIDSGFDGVFLDIVDGYMNFED